MVFGTLIAQLIRHRGLKKKLRARTIFLATSASYVPLLCSAVGLCVVLQSADQVVDATVHSRTPHEATDCQM